MTSMKMVKMREMVQVQKTLAYFHEWCLWKSSPVVFRSLYVVLENGSSRTLPVTYQYRRGPVIVGVSGPPLTTSWASLG
jgi:hypothetical protein